MNSIRPGYIQLSIWDALSQPGARVAGTLSQPDNGATREAFRGRDTLFRRGGRADLFHRDRHCQPFIVVVPVGGYDTLAGTIHPSLAYVGFSVFDLRQCFRNLPARMPEAACVGGAGIWRQCHAIVLILARLARRSLFQALAPGNGGN